MKGLLLTYVMTYGGTAVALWKPFVGLLVYVSFAILRPDALWDYSVPQGNYSRIVFVGLFVGWLLAGGGEWRFGRARGPMLALCVYLLWSVASAFGAIDKPLAWANVESTAKIIVPILIGLSLITSMRQLRQLAWTIVLSQGILAVEFNLSYYEGFNRLVAVGFAGMDEKTVAITMIVGAAVSLFLGLNEKRMLYRMIAFGLAALMIHVPLFAFSRSGMLGLIAVGAFAVWLMPKRPVHIAVVVGSIALGLRLAGPEVRAFFATSFVDQSERDGSAESRLVLWGQAWETMLENPVLGLGPRNWGNHAATAYGWERAKEVHNTWLQTGAELGFPGMVALAGFFVFLSWRLLPLARGREREGTADEENLARMVVCALAGFVVAAQFITVYGIEVPYHTALIGAGLLKLRSIPGDATVRQPAADSVIGSFTYGRGRSGRQVLEPAAGIPTVRVNR